MSFVQTAKRSVTFQSVDVKTTVHGSCRHCHHFFHASSIQLHFSRNGSYQNKVICSECGRENMALGGHAPRLSWMSQMTVTNSRGHLANLANFFSSGGHNTIGRSRGSSLSHHVPPVSPNPDGRRTSSSVELEQREEDDIQMVSGQGLSAQRTAAHDVHISIEATPRPLPSDESTESPERILSGRTFNVTAWPGQAGLRRIISKIRKSPRRFLVLVRRLRHASNAEKNVAQVGAGGINQPSPVAAAQEDVQSTSHNVTTSAASHSSHSLHSDQVEMPFRASKFCPECKVNYERQRFDMTMEKLARDQANAAGICPRTCCVMARQHGVSDTEFAERTMPVESLVELDSRDVTRAVGTWVAESRRHEHNRSTLSLESDSQQTTQVDQVQ